MSATFRPTCSWVRTGCARFRELRIDGDRPASLQLIVIERCPALVVPAALADTGA
jgi:hypothetical protein